MSSRVPRPGSCEPAAVLRAHDSALATYAANIAMVNTLAASLVDALTGLEIAGIDGPASNGFALKGLAVRAAQDGALEVRAQTAEAASLRMVHGAFVLQVGQLVLHDLACTVHLGEGGPRLSQLQVARAEVSAASLQGPVVFTPRQVAAASQGTWSLAPLAAADGKIRAQIKDATLIFDADVTVPIRAGQVDFNEATVEHVGPDSHMGVSKLGIYVDAPNGRSYLYQFSPAPVAGVAYERRGAFLGQRVSDRGSLQLQAFAEAMLLHATAGPGAGFTDQARLLLARTALSGFVQLGDGNFAAPGLEAELSGRGAERNIVRLQSDAVGRGLTLDLAALSVQHAVLNALGARVTCDEVTGTAKLQLLVDGSHLRFALEVAQMQMVGIKA